MRNDLVEQAQAIRAGMRALATSAPDDVLLSTIQAVYDVWVPGEHYDYNQPLTHNGKLYRVAQAGGVDALENQPPDAEGMLAVYALSARRTPAHRRTRSRGYTAWTATRVCTTLTTILCTCAMLT